MDHLKYILSNTCDEFSPYAYDQVGELAEIFYKTNLRVPIALLEWHSTSGLLIKFRLGLTSQEIASISRDLAEVETGLVFEEDFHIDPDLGYLYGEDATRAFIISMQDNIRMTEMEKALQGATYVSHEPIFAVGTKNQGKTKIEKYWDLDD